MNPALLEYLACPACGGELALSVQSETEGEVLEGKLDCRTCSASYRISGGIPRMLRAPLGAEQQATAEAFGYEWTHFTDLDEQYRAEFLDWIKPITPEFFRDKVVLDAGCGKGRHAFLSAEFGAREVLAVDVSEAVLAAYANTRHLPHVHVVQADIYALPFRRPFDYMYSIGVLHHLPNPRAGFQSLVRHLKPGGRVSVWVYGREGNGWIVKVVNPLRIYVTSRLPKVLTRIVSFAFAVPLYLALKLAYGPVNQRESLRSLRKLLFYNDYLSEIARYSFSENYWNVFDHLVAPTAFYLQRQEVENWFVGFESKEITQKTGNSWRGTGVVRQQPSPENAELSDTVIRQS